MHICINYVAVRYSGWETFKLIKEYVHRQGDILKVEQIHFFILMNSMVTLQHGFYTTGDTNFLVGRRVLISIPAYVGETDLLNSFSPAICSGTFHGVDLQFDI